jgi:hypothetical protein
MKALTLSFCGTLGFIPAFLIKSLGDSASGSTGKDALVCVEAAEAERDKKDNAYLDYSGQGWFRMGCRM